MIKGICKHFNISLTDQDLKGPVIGLEIDLSLGLCFDELKEKVKTLKIKKKKAKVGLSHDFVKSNKIPVKVKT